MRVLLYENQSKKHWANNNRAYIRFYYFCLFIPYFDERSVKKRLSPKFLSTPLGYDLFYRLIFQINIYLVTKTQEIWDRPILYAMFICFYPKFPSWASWAVSRYDFIIDRAYNLYELKKLSTPSLPFECNVEIIPRCKFFLSMSHWDLNRIVSKLSITLSDNIYILTIKAWNVHSVTVHSVTIFEWEV